MPEMNDYHAFNSTSGGSGGGFGCSGTVIGILVVVGILWLIGTLFG